MYVYLFLPVVPDQVVQSVYIRRGVAYGPIPFMFISPPLAKEAVLLLFLLAPLRFLTLIIILPLRVFCDLLQFLFVPPARYFYVSLLFLISDPTAVFIPSAFFLVLSVQFVFWRYMIEWKKSTGKVSKQKSRTRGAVRCR